MIGMADASREVRPGRQRRAAHALEDALVAGDATVIARLVKVAVTMAKTMIAGVKKRGGASPNRVLNTTMNRSGNTNVKKAAGGLRQKLRFS